MQKYTYPINVTAEKMGIEKIVFNDEHIMEIHHKDGSIDFYDYKWRRARTIVEKDE